ncbi:hypothetical protein DFP72DRAFT_854210 [Ephemerocybe angulata]|uniref:Uncharacterized protein n=1 Tax=Ephemerocybe angulata TaxID=980116 RepID=A0A8H6HKW8_9AGAR|nr:hypothetical protein DFP72DRAFT_854210 [Tulosesus angulatus]
MNANNTAQSHPQAPAPGQETHERTPTPAELIARLNEQNQTLSLATIMEYEQSPDLFRRALRDIPSFKSLNPGPNNYITDWEIKAFLAKVTRAQTPGKGNTEAADSLGPPSYSYIYAYFFLLVTWVVDISTSRFALLPRTIVLRALKKPPWESASGAL